MAEGQLLDRWTLGFSKPSLTVSRGSCTSWSVSVFFSIHAFVTCSCPLEVSRQVSHATQRECSTLSFLRKGCIMRRHGARQVSYIAGEERRVPSFVLIAPCLPGSSASPTALVARRCTRQVPKP